MDYNRNAIHQEYITLQPLRQMCACGLTYYEALVPHNSMLRHSVMELLLGSHFVKTAQNNGLQVFWQSFYHLRVSHL
jgi:hypothetical protein